MKIALATTTVHVPHALKLLRKCSADVRFFVAIDEKTSEEAANFCAYDIDNTQVVYFDAEERWKCGKAIGRNTLAKRNLAFLEALAWGAEVIVSHDDDNIPSGNVGHTDYFAQFAWAIGHTFNGVKVANYTAGWFDPGTLLVPPARHRGFPFAIAKDRIAGPITNAKIGVAAGLVIGDPDIDATTRMEHRPDIGNVHILGSTGVVVDPHTWTVFNSQNTAVIRELMPSWFMMPGVGRHDDIYASLIVQRVARERGLHVHFGPPFTYQQRNQHDLIKDLRAEIDGMENTAKLAELLDHIVLPATSVIDQTHSIYETMHAAGFIGDLQLNAAVRWLEDCEGILE